MNKPQPNPQISIQPDVEPERSSSPPPTYSSMPLLPQPVTQGGSWKDRNCPGMRSLFNFSLSSYSLHTDDKAVLGRRICMIAVLGCRFFIPVIGIIYNLVTLHLLSLIISVIFAVIGFIFVAWCLAKIGDAEGERIVFGTRVGRWHLDVFLLVIALLHMGILIGSFLGLGGSEISATWIILWLVIFAVAWITTWDPQPETYV